MRTGIAELPLHNGKCPKWLFPKMVKLSKCIMRMIVEEYGKKEILKRLSNPFFFQALGCVLGYDWHSSGLTTTTTAALKEAFNQLDVGIAVLGGKGKASRKTLEEIDSLASKFSFTYSKTEKLKQVSRLVSKVDNSLVQDNYTLYHHAFIVTENGHWAVIQQGMNPQTHYARRYHWLDEKTSSFLVEPHAAIVGEKEKNVLDMTNRENLELQKCSVDLVKENTETIKRYFYSPQGLIKFFRMPPEHTFDQKVYEKIKKLHEFNPKNYEELILFKGIGPKTVRALALLSSLIYGTEISWKDPVKYSFAHGGKDRIPYPVDRKTYDESIKTLEEIINDLLLKKEEKIRALKRLKNLVKPEGR